MCLRFADRPCFKAADPTIFSPKIKKARLLSDPARVVPDFSTGIQIFADSILFGMKSNLLRIPSDFVNPRWRHSRHFLFKKKKVITKVRKACLKQQDITR